MSDNKTYVPKANAKEVTFQSGNSIVKIGLHAETVAAFLLANANAKGYVNLGLSRRKSVGNYGETHCLWLDTWEPRQDAGSSGGRQDTSPTPKTQPRPVSAPAKAIPSGGIDDADVPRADDVPF